MRGGPAPCACSCRRVVQSVRRVIEASGVRPGSDPARRPPEPQFPRIIAARRCQLPGRPDIRPSGEQESFHEESRGTNCGLHCSICVTPGGRRPDDQTWTGDGVLRPGPQARCGRESVRSLRHRAGRARVGEAGTRHDAHARQEGSRQPPGQVHARLDHRHSRTSPTLRIGLRRVPVHSGVDGLRRRLPDRTGALPQRSGQVRRISPRCP